MKQNITQKQWDELNRNQQKDYILTIPDSKQVAYVEGMWELITIGQMIEFLGDKLIKIEYNSILKIYNVVCWDKEGEKQIEYSKIELISSLWEAVKYKYENKHRMR